MSFVETAEKNLKEQDWVVNETNQNVEDTTESEVQLKSRLLDQNQSLDSIHELIEIYKEHEVECSVV